MLKVIINSFLAQIFTDFELIISDNTSADKFVVNCREYIEKDKRICYVQKNYVCGLVVISLTLRFVRSMLFDFFPGACLKLGVRYV